MEQRGIIMKPLAQFKLFVLIALTSATLYANPVVKTHSLNLSKPGEPVNLEVEVRYGSITIEGYKGKTVEVQATFQDLDAETMKKFRNRNYDWDKENRSAPRSSDGLKRVKNTRIHLEIEEEDNHVSIGSEVQNRQIDLVIKVPTTSNIQASVYDKGDLSIKGITGKLELSNHRGGINAMNINGPIVAETWRADIVIGFDGYNTEHPSSFSSHHGNIDISIPERKAKMELIVNTYRGEILSGIDTDFVPSDEIRKNNDGQQEITIGGAMSAKINGGGQTLTAQTYGGNIYVRKR